MGTDDLKHYQREVSNINPAHYRSGEIEAIEVMRYLHGNLYAVVKYVCRSGLKGDELEDLRKAEWHLNDQIEHFGGMIAPIDCAIAPHRLWEGLVSNRAACVRAVCEGRLMRARHWLTREIERVERIRRPRLPAAGESGR